MRQNQCFTLACTLEYTIFVLGILAFAILSYMPNYNIGLFYTINSWHNLIPTFIYTGLTLIAESRTFILPIILLILTYSYRQDKLNNVILLIISYYVVFYALKHLVLEPRPYMILASNDFYLLPGVKSLIHEAYQSFPSGHAGVATIFTVSCFKLFDLKAFMKSLLIGVLVLVVASRILTGWHWPSDIIAGYLLGYILSKISLILPLKLKPTKTKVF